MSSAYAGAAVMVTGAGGFIGSRLARRLLDGGARVVAPARAGRRLDPRCEPVEADILDPPSVARALDEHGVVAVFHLAAQSIVERAYREPLTTFEVNVRGTYCVLDACRTSGAPLSRIVVASSYLTEPRPTDPYATSKVCAETISRSYAHAYGLPVALLRLANVYGGGDLNFSRLVPDAARALVRGERPVVRSDGTPERDFLYVEDAVDAYLTVAGSLDDPAARGRAWNGGAGETLAVAELVRRLIAAAGLDLEPVVEGRATSRSARDCRPVDSSALRDELGWRPSWDLERGLAATYRWYERELS